MSQRAVKRVPLDFSWTLGEVWHGYINPWPGPVPCPSCYTSGLNPMSKRLMDTFRSWAPKATIDEVRQLTERGHSPLETRNLKRRVGLDSPVLRMNLTEIRGRRKGFWGQCASCQGHGFVADPNPAVVSLYRGVNLYDEWEPTNPPSGTGWQLWDADYDGSPISPVFDTGEKLARWCAQKVDKKQDLASWMRWVSTYPSKGGQMDPRAPFRIMSDTLRVFVPPPSPKHLD